LWTRPASTARNDRPNGAKSSGPAATPTNPNTAAVTARRCRRDPAFASNQTGSEPHSAANPHAAAGNVSQYCGTSAAAESGIDAAPHATGHQSGNAADFCAMSVGATFGANRSDSASFVAETASFGAAGMSAGAS
jgi:hypothetical protein